MIVGPASLFLVPLCFSLVLKCARHGSSPFGENKNHVIIASTNYVCWFLLRSPEVSGDEGQD